MEMNKEKISTILKNNAGSIYIGIILFGLPIYTHDMLYDISIAKYLFFVYATILFCVLWLFIEKVEIKKSIFSKTNKEDWLYLFFLVCAFASSLGSEYPKKAMTGEAGRHIGFWTYVISGCAFAFIVTIPYIKKYVFYIWGMSSIIVGIIGISNHFGKDPLNFFAEMYDDQIPFFVSTMGNVDFFSAYMAFVFVFFSMLFIKTSRLSEKILGAVTGIISGMAVNSTCADAGYIMIILFAVYGWIIADNMSEFMKICECIVVVLITAIIIGKLDKRIPKVRKLDGIGNFLSTSKVTIIMSIVMFALIFIILFMKRIYISGRVQNMNMSFEKTKFIIVKICIVLTIIGTILVLIINISPINISNIAILSNLKITDDFGTTRGYVWRKTIEYFKLLPIENKIFGIGPDLAIFAYDKILYINPTVELPATFDNAHNEFLQLLLTHGLAGVITYYGWIILSAVRLLKERKQNYISGIIGFSIVCYLVMMQVCVNVIYLTFIPFLILCVGKNGRYK